MAILAISFAGREVSAAESLLPDLIVREREMLDHDLVTDGNRVLLRLSTATANIGSGPLRVVGVVPVPAGENQAVNQVIFRDDGSNFTRPAGTFEYHPTHRHVHLENWAVYRLRESLEGGAVGGIVAEGGKTSFCLLDSLVHDAGLPGTPLLAVYNSCGDSAQGISVGWADYYDRTLYGQNINVLGLAKGTYWLEVVVDPENHILEEDEGNNVARVPVEIGEPVLVNGPLRLPLPTALTTRLERSIYSSATARGLDSIGAETCTSRAADSASKWFRPQDGDIPQSRRKRGSSRTHLHRPDLAHGRAIRNWSHFEGGAGTSENVTAAMIRDGHSFELGAESLARFRSVGRKRRGHDSQARMERLSMDVVDGSVRDLVRVSVSP